MSTLSIQASDNSGEFSAYIARPDTPSAPVIILIQEIFGVNQEMRDKCDAYAESGYIAICPDLFWRIEPGIELVDSKEDELQRAFDLFGQFNVDKGMEDLKATLKTARTLEGSNGQVGCVGYCLGGKLAYMMSTHTDVDASVGYYGVAIESMVDQKDKITKPLMLHLAEKDEFVPPEAQEIIKSAFKDHQFVTVHSYEGVDHAFARGQGMHYDREVAELANARTADFFKANLKQAMAA